MLGASGRANASRTGRHARGQGSPRGGTCAWCAWPGAPASRPSREGSIYPPLPERGHTSPVCLRLASALHYPAPYLHAVPFPCAPAARPVPRSVPSPNPARAEPCAAQRERLPAQYLCADLI
jgi:hypothetical protein